MQGQAVHTQLSISSDSTVSHHCENTHTMVETNDSVCTEVPMDEPVELSPDTSMCRMIQHEGIAIATHSISS